MRHGKNAQIDGGLFVHARGETDFGGIFETITLKVIGDFEDGRGLSVGVDCGNLVGVTELEELAKDALVYRDGNHFLV